MSMYNPPMPEWNGLRTEDRDEIEREFGRCSCCGVHSQDPERIYAAIRDQLQERERYYNRATMNACTRCGKPKGEHHHDGACYGVCGKFEGAEA